MTQMPMCSIRKCDRICDENSYVCEGTGDLICDKCMHILMRFPFTPERYMKAENRFYRSLKSVKDLVISQGELEEALYLCWRECHMHSSNYARNVCKIVDGLIDEEDRQSFTHLDEAK